MNKKIAVVGLQWGDEGKGKIVDFLAQNSDYVIRFNGGNNAGHTVVTGKKVFKFHHLPSGAVLGKKLLIGQGCVINPKVLLEEIKNLNKYNIYLKLMIDPRVHIVMPYHQILDAATEEWKGKKATGSLKLGIGYCYEDKNNRLGIRFEDILDKKILTDKIKSIYPLKKAIIEKVFANQINTSAAQIITEYGFYGKKLKKYIGDVALEVWNNWETSSMIFEAAHGTFLDPSFGTYPYTVAPPSTIGALFSGVGIGPVELKVLGVVKAYTTRVGNGPFPTEQKNKTGSILQEVGKEFGTTSGRVRRCGWLDLVMLRSAIKLNNVSSLAVTKLDVFSSFNEIYICVSYRYNRRKIKYFPATMNNLLNYIPAYKKFAGWKKDISQIKKLDDLPKNCRYYLEFIESQLGVPVKYISVSADRKGIIHG